MGKKLAQCESIDILEVVKYYGGKVFVFFGKVANHPLTKPIVYITGGLLIGNRVMKNGYDATADLGFASFSLTRRT